MKADPYDGLMKPRLGSIVLYRCPRQRPDYFEDSDQLPAIVTRVRSISCLDIVVFPHASGFSTVQVAAAEFGEGDHQWTWPDIPQSENPLKVQK
jgi:hypothetical protein